MKKKWILFMIVGVLFVSLTLQPREGQAATFPDIPKQYEKEINFLIGEGVITGYPNNTFGPNNKVTREVAVTMVGRALGLDGKKRSSKFKDVDKNSFGSGYIASAVEKGIITGYPDGTFRPSEYMTRGGMAYLLQKAFELEGNNKTVFRDVPSSNKELYVAVDALATNGLTNGYPDDNTYRPNNPITRVAFSLLVARGLNEQFRVANIVDEKVVNVASTLNVRSGPGTNYSKIGSLQNGTKVQVINEQGNWAYVKVGALVGYVHSSYLVTSKPKPPQQSTRRVIAIDAGHGGTDPGSSGNKLVEKQITLQVAKRVEQSLKKKGIDVYMTRTNDTYVGLEQRVDQAVKAGADTFLSIHTNSFTSESANGTETYYSLARTVSRAEDSKQLATFVQNRLVKALGTRDRGVKTAKFVVIHKNPLPSALVELAFISNKADAQKLASATYQQKAADAIANGIVDYYNWKDKN